MEAEKLMKLARYLVKVPPNRFDFKVIVQGSVIPNQEDNCGTMACALGNLPFVFPERFEYRINGMGRVKVHDKEEDAPLEYLTYVEPICSFFDLGAIEVLGLFSAYEQDSIGQKELTGEASPLEVAQNIASYVSRHSSVDTSL